MGKLIKAISDMGGVIAYLVDSTDIVNKARRYHGTSATASAALGRLLTAASMMGSVLKDDDGTITLRISGGGSVGAIIAVSDAFGNVRGYAVNPAADLPPKKNGKLDVSGIVGTDGNFSVSRDVGMPEPQTSHCKLVSGEIAEDITYYYAISEQIPTACALGVLVDTDLSIKTAGGFMAQLLPGANDEDIDILERNVGSLPPVTTMLDEGLTIHDIAAKLFDGLGMQILEEHDVEYRCTCSREAVERAIISLGAKELDAIIEEDGKAEVNCHFCIKKYRFSKDELIALKESL